jgi:hypothetical protein
MRHASRVTGALLPQALECWDYRCMLPLPAELMDCGFLHLGCFVFFSNEEHCGLFCTVFIMFSGQVSRNDSLGQRQAHSESS